MNRTHKNATSCVYALGLGMMLVAFSQEASAIELFTKSRDVKGYGKRDRVFPVSSQTVSPSQLHEIYGQRVDAGADVTSTNARYSDDKVRATSPSGSVRGFVGGDILTLGLAGSRAESSGRTNTAVAAKEREISKKFIPSLAATIQDHVTVGVSSEMNWVELRQNSDVTSERVLEGYTRREAIGLAYHTSKWEVGAVHSTYNSNRANVKEGQYQGSTGLAFGLVEVQDQGPRTLYVPASNGIYARGNVTDNWSFEGNVNRSEYDANVDGAKPYFKDYHNADRLAGQLQAIYWLNDEATRFAATAQYRGATYAPFAVEENELGYRDANLYGGALDAVFEVSKETYVGVRLAYLRGERDQDFNGGRVVAREDRATIGTTFSKSM